MARTPTIRTLAASLGLSRSTVSSALRGSSQVSPATAARVLAEAEAVGYRINPLAATMMSEMRRSRGAVFRGTLAIINFEELGRPPYLVRYQEQMIIGAKARAHELGFNIEYHNVGHNAIRIRRLDQILRSRGTRGMMLLPAWRDQSLTDLDWSRYSSVYMDYHLEWPPLHCVCTDHFRAMTMALQYLWKLGYRRPGLILPHHYDGRLDRRWEGAFLAFRRDNPVDQPVPPLIEESINQTVFTDWFERHQPDVVVGHFAEAIGWMRACGAQVPDTHGFFCLNVLHAEQPCAGLDLAPRLIGAHSVELAVAQLHRNEYGPPQLRAFVTLPSSISEGPTVSPRTHTASVINAG